MKEQTLTLHTFSTYEKIVIGILVLLQFTVILDFIIIAPLGAIIMPALNITPSQFGLVVSAYAFSAGVSGFLAAGIADKYDRKKLIFFFYTGFIIGTLLCGIAHSYTFLFAARIISGIFGGVIGSIVLAITVDLFALSKRGRVMGFIQTSFALSQIIGVPTGLYFSNHFGWNMPFFFIAMIGILASIAIIIYLNPIADHLKLNVKNNAMKHLFKTLTTPVYLLGIATTMLLSLGGFMIMPFASNFLVHNVQVGLSNLPSIYFITGIFAIIAGPLIGRATDTFGKLKIFYTGTFLSILMVVIYTNMGITPLPLVIAINVLFFIGILSRMIPSQALTSSIPEMESRGSYMAVSASMQQFAGAFASVLAGYIVIQNPDYTISHFNVLGYITIGTMMLTLILMYFVNQVINKKSAHLNAESN